MKTTSLCANATPSKYATSRLMLVIGLLLFALPATAALPDGVQIYGRAHLSTDILGDGSDYGLNVSSNSSRFGVRASHQVQDNLEVFMQLEQNVRFDQRGGNFATRDSFAGLRGDWGQLRVGSFDTPGKLLRAKADVLNDRLGDLRNMASGGGMSFDPRFRNSIHYRSPRIYQTTFDIQYSPHNATDATTENDLEAISIALNYSHPRAWLGIAYEMTEGSEYDPTAVRMGAGYNFTPAWQGIVFYQHASDLRFGQRDVFGGGARYRFGDYAWMGQVYHATANDLEDSAGTMAAVGFDYYISPELTLYAILGGTDNEGQAAFSVSAGGRDTTVIPQPGNTASGLSLGFIYNF